MEICLVDSITARRPEWLKHRRKRVVEDEVGEVVWGVFRASKLAMRTLTLSSSKGDGSHEWVWSRGRVLPSLGFIRRPLVAVKRMDCVELGRKPAGGCHNNADERGWYRLGWEVMVRWGVWLYCEGRVVGLAI